MLWVQATEWLRPDNHRVEDLELVERARSLMAKVPWGMRAWALSGWDATSYTGFLVRFLSFSWLGEQNINMMGICYNAMTAEGDGKMRGYVAPFYLGSQLQRIGDWDAQRIQDNSDLGGWRDMVTKGRYCYLHILTNLARAHWVVFHIDIQEQTYSWGQLLMLTWMDTCANLNGLAR